MVAQVSTSDPRCALRCQIQRTDWMLLAEFTQSESSKLHIVLVVPAKVEYEYEDESSVCIARGKSACE